MAHAPGLMIARRSADDKRVASRSARRAVTQLDLFGGALRARRRPFTPERLAAMAIGIFNASRPVQGTIGAKFFEMRHLAVPGPDVVRYHPALTFNEGRCPGLIWLLRDVRTNKPCGAMRIFLDECGWVVGKKALGRCWGATLNRAPRPP